VADLRRPLPVFQTFILVIGVKLGSPDLWKTPLAADAFPGVRAKPCGNTAASLKPTPSDSGGPMSGIYMILVFVGVLAALNYFEFGRFD